jgi:hypothetical protein
MNLEQVSSLTDLDEIRRQLDICEKQEDEIEKELEGIINSTTINDYFEELERFKPFFKKTKVQLLELFERINSSSILAEHISDKVRVLDAKQQEIRKAIELRDDSLVAQNCVQGAVKAFHAKDYFRAANFIASFNSFDNIEYLNVSAQQIEEINNCKKDLVLKFKSDFTRALTQNDEELLINCLRMFPMIGEEEYGLIDR